MTFPISIIFMHCLGVGSLSDTLVVVGYPLFSVRKAQRIRISSSVAAYSFGENFCDHPQFLFVPRIVQFHSMKTQLFDLSLVVAIECEDLRSKTVRRIILEKLESNSRS